MSRGLGKQQQEIKRVLQRAWDTKIGLLTFASIRGVFIISAGGNPETDKLRPAVERSLKRSLKTLVDRGDVVIISGEGGQRSPFTYTTVEAFVSEPNTNDAKRVLKELKAAVAGMSPQTAGKLAKLSTNSP